MSLWSALFPRQTRPQPHNRPSLTLFFLLTGAFLLTLVPHVLQFPLWLSLLIFVAMIFRSIIEFYRLPLPSITFCAIVAVLLFGAVWYQFSTISGRQAGTALTAGLLAIKFYELRRPRDIALIIFSCFFVVMSALLYSQVLELFIYCLIMMWVLTALLLRVHTGDMPNDHLLQMLGRSGVIFLQALPLALILFFFFPRYTGKLTLSLDEPVIGLSDTVAPGSIAKLSKNDTDAMYVEFLSRHVPTTDMMYWRALVLWHYRNGVWTQGLLSTLPPHKESVLVPEADRINQEITIKAHSQKWLFALDVPVTVPENTAEGPGWATRYNGDTLQLQAPYAKLDHTERYNVTSNPTPLEQELRDDEAFAATQLPPDNAKDHIDSDVRALADKLDEGLTPDQHMQYIGNVLHYFRHEGFDYSPEPGVLGPDWLHDFLFKTKSGFCEHFASAFAVLMRIKKIPTRLVVGYQGGDFNPYQNHYIVSQSNAHAWDEVWVKKDPTGTSRWGHWMRVDPTAVVPMVEGGLPISRSEALTDALVQQIAHPPPTFAQQFLPAWAEDTLKEMRMRRDEVETNWDNLVFSYDPGVQVRWAQSMGFGRQANLKLLLICLAAAGVCFIIFKKWMARKPSVSPVENFYAVFCRNMAQRGIPRATWEGPLAYTERVAEAFPDDKQAIYRVGSIVAHARYGPPPVDPSAPHDLQSLLTVITASQAATTSRERR